MNAYSNILLVALTMSLAVTPALALPDRPKSPLHEYASEDYVIYTDLGADQAREAQIRMTRMEAEYRRWTGFVSADPIRRLPLYLFGNSEDFYAAGGPHNAAGAFIGNALLAVATAGDWHTLQHEGFHQFVAAAAPGNALPPWVEEGFAEYFGEGIFTGDGYVCGVGPAWRLRRLKSEITTHQLKPLSALLGLSPKQWNDELSLANYDQAWSLVQMFAVGAEGRYRFAFAGFVNALRSGHPAEQAWAAHLPPTEQIQKEWEDEWLALSDDPTRVLYAQAAVAALSSCLGRAVSGEQRFDSFTDFSCAAKSGLLRNGSEDWLPPSVALGALESLRGLGATCVLQFDRGDSPRIVAVLPERVRIDGSFVLRTGRVKRVRTETAVISNREVPPVPLPPLPPARNAE